MENQKVTVVARIKGVLGVALSLLVGLAASVPLAWLYVHMSLSFERTIVGGPVAVVMFCSLFGFAVGFAGFVGRILGEELGLERVDKLGVNILVGAAIGLWAWYFSWVVWVEAVIDREEVGLLSVLLRPGLLWKTIVETNMTGGVWDPRSLFGLTPTGVALWILWVFEGVWVVSVSTLLSASGSDA
ncbi:hypothetical protein MYX77_09150 [Acidobacteriia bacterium AH_259_A11_L15]|nr:hypothetical protein [Acidobacteriia bacterium AH_259_A11_L15]